MSDIDYESIARSIREALNEVPDPREINKSEPRWRWDSYHRDVADLFDELESLIHDLCSAESQSVAQQPVGWGEVFDDGSVEYYDTRAQAEEAAERPLGATSGPRRVAPLYLHPPASTESRFVGQDAAWAWAHGVGLHRRVHAGLVRTVPDKCQRVAAYEAVANAIDETLAKLFAENTESQSVGQPRPYFRMAGHLDDAIREGRRGDARALAVSIARLMGADIPEHTESKSVSRQIDDVMDAGRSAAETVESWPQWKQDLSRDPKAHAPVTESKSVGQAEPRDENYTHEEWAEIQRFERSPAPATESKSVGQAISLTEVLREIERRLDSPVIDDADLRERKAMLACRDVLRSLFGESEATECKSVAHARALRKLCEAQSEMSRLPRLAREGTFPVYLRADEIEALQATECRSVDRRDGEG